MIQDCKKAIAELQARLIEEVKQKTYIEVKIREEVCQEMAEQLVEIEKNYKLVLSILPKCWLRSNNSWLCHLHTKGPLCLMLFNFPIRSYLF